MPDVAGTPPLQPAKKDGLLTRREFIRNTVRLAVAGAVIPGALTQLLPSVAPLALSGGGPGPIIRRDPATNAKIPLTITDLKEQPGNQPFVGEYAFLPAIVYKVKVSVLQGSARYQKYNTAQHAVAYPGDPKYAILAYVGKCKHLGCTVGWNGTLGASKPEVGLEDYDGDGINDGRILCPCHQGQYDIHNLARNQPGTPPPAPLNVIRINVAASYPGDQDNKIPAGSNVILGVETLVQDKYRDADVATKGGGSTAYNLRDPTKIVIKPKDYSWETTGK